MQNLRKYFSHRCSDEVNVLNRISLGYTVGPNRLTWELTYPINTRLFKIDTASLSGTGRWPVLQPLDDIVFWYRCYGQELVH